MESNSLSAPTYLPTSLPWDKVGMETAIYSHLYRTPRCNSSPSESFPMSGCNFAQAFDGQICRRGFEGEAGGFQSNSSFRLKLFIWPPSNAIAPSNLFLTKTTCFPNLRSGPSDLSGEAPNLSPYKISDKSVVLFLEPTPSTFFPNNP